MKVSKGTLLASAMFAALVLSRAAAAQPDSDGAPPAAELHAGELGVCRAAADLPACILQVLGRANPASDADLLAADKRGDAPPVALHAVDALADRDQILVLTGVCRASLGLTPSWWGPGYRARQAALRPSRPLAQAAADRLEVLLRPAGPEKDARTILAVCRAALGDVEGADRALDTLPEGSGDVRAQMLKLIFAGQYDKAASLSETASAERVILPTMPLRSVFQFALLQRSRERLLLVSQDAGRPDISARAAESILTAAVGDDRPENRLMDSGLPAALAWLLTQPDTARALSWVERADAFVRPGQPGWNFADAIAVHRAWLRLGQPEKARVLYVAIAAEASKPTLQDDAEAADTAALTAAGLDDAFMAAIIASARPTTDDGPGGAKRVAAEMLAEAGQWDDATAAGVSALTVLRDDLRGEPTAATLADRLGHAGSDEERVAVLQLCAASPGWDVSDPLSVPQAGAVPLELAAGCVRDLAAAAGRLVGSPRGASPGLIVAFRAIETDRPELAREMLGLTLESWQGANSQDAVLDQPARSRLVDIAAGLRASTSR